MGAVMRRRFRTGFIAALFAMGVVVFASGCSLVGYLTPGPYADVDAFAKDAGFSSLGKVQWEVDYGGVADQGPTHQVLVIGPQAYQAATTILKKYDCTEVAPGQSRCRFRDKTFVVQITEMRNGLVVLKGGDKLAHARGPGVNVEIIA